MLQVIGFKGVNESLEQLFAADELEGVECETC
jgi:hypothetical protein